MDDENEVNGGLTQVQAPAPVSPGLSQVSAPPKATLSPVEVATKAYQDERKKLIDIQNQLLASLEARVGGGPQDIFRAMAEGFGAPTKTGSFGESLGYASKAMGDVIERGQKGQFDIAKLRAELAAQQIGMSEKDLERVKKEQAFGLIGQALGVPTGQEIPSIGGILSPDEFKRLIKVYPRVAEYDKEAGQTLKNAFEMTDNLVKRMLEAKKLGIDEGEFVAKYGPSAMEWLKELGGRTTASQPPVGQPPVGQPPVGQTPAVGQAPAGQAPAVDQEPASSSIPRIPGESDKTYQERIAKYYEERNKEYKEPIEFYTSLDPSNLKKSLINLEEINNYVNEDKERVRIMYERNLKKGMSEREARSAAENQGSIFGYFKNGGFRDALAQAANQGLGVGQFRITAPVQEFIKSLKDPQLQSRMTRVVQLLGEQFLQNARQNKGVLGAQVSNFDAQMFLRPIADIGDPRDTIGYWVKQNILYNKEKEDMYRDYSDHIRANKQPFQYMTSKRRQDTANKYYSYQQQFMDQNKLKAPTNDVGEDVGFFGRALRGY